MSAPTLEELIRARFGACPDIPDEMNADPNLCRLLSRGSCRAFADAPVSVATLETLSAAALCAPSKSDLQQRDILIVSDPALRGEIKRLLGAQAWIAGAPSLVVFLANNRRQRQVQALQDQPFPNDHLDAFFNASVDAGIALSFFMAAAEAAGFGCCPISTIRNHMEEVARLLDLPDHVFAVAGMAVGVPLDTPRVSARLPLAHTVHHNSYQDTPEEEILTYDTRRNAGSTAPGWSEAKAKMYAEPQRTDFGDFIRKIGFNLD